MKRIPLFKNKFTFKGKESDSIEIICNDCGHFHGCKASKTPWRRILYEKQTFDDNFVPDSFLSKMVTNENISIPSFWTMVRKSSVVIQQISLLSIFLCVFSWCYSEIMSLYHLLFIDLIILIIGCSSRMYVEPLGDLGIGGLLGRSLIFIGCIFLLSPILLTLTQTISDDTIWALTICLSSLHIAFFDYQYVLALSNDFQGTLSLNAGIFVSVLLASRLQSPIHVFAFICFSLLILACSPFLIHCLKKNGFFLIQETTILIVCLTIQLLFLISSLLLIVYVFSMIFIAIVCPFWLKWIQRYKCYIQGPWDYDVETELKFENIFSSNF